MNASCNWVNLFRHQFSLVRAPWTFPSEARSELQLRAVNKRLDYLYHVGELIGPNKDNTYSFGAKYNDTGPTSTR